MISIKKFNLLELVLFTFSVSITFYLAKFTSISPIYVIYLVMLFPIMIIYIYVDKIIITVDSVLLFFLFLYILLSFIFNHELKINGEIINITTAILAYIYIRSIKDKISITTIINSFNLLLWISTITIAVSSIYRILNPFAPLATMRYIDKNEDMLFYLYKYNSLLFADSNTSALILLVMYFSIITIEKYSTIEVNYKILKLFIIILLISTLSRSAFFALVFSLMIIKLREVRSIVIKISILTFILFIVIYISSLIMKDPSFLSKLEILDLVEKYINSSSYDELFFGIGAGNAIKKLEIYTHSLYLTYLVEEGIFGFFLFFIFIFYYVYKFSWIIILPVLVASISYFLYLGTPFLFVPLALTANLIEKRNVIENTIHSTGT